MHYMTLPVVVGFIYHACKCKREIDSFHSWCFCRGLFSGEAELAYRAALRECTAQEIIESWNLVKNVADLVIAINALPWRPFLWAGKLQSSRSAAFGTISSLVGLHLFIQAQRKAKSLKWSCLQFTQYAQPTPGLPGARKKFRDQFLKENFRIFLSVSRGSRHRKCTFFCAHKS